MKKTKLHPNTTTLLSAWQRITGQSDAVDDSPSAIEHAELIASLFVLERDDHGEWVFQTVGPTLERTMERELVDHDYASLWNDDDRQLANAFLNIVWRLGRPGILSTSGKTLTGEQIDIEITHAPLRTPTSTSKRDRLLGLYQTLQPQTQRKGRPIWRHEIVSMHPPERTKDKAAIRLVSSNRA